MAYYTRERYSCMPFTSLLNNQECGAITGLKKKFQDVIIGDCYVTGAVTFVIGTVIVNSWQTSIERMICTDSLCTPFPHHIEKDIHICASYSGLVLLLTTTTSHQNVPWSIFKSHLSSAHRIATESACTGEPWEAGFQSSTHDGDVHEQWDPGFCKAFPQWPCWISHFFKFWLYRQYSTGKLVRYKQGIRLVR